MALEGQVPLPLEQQLLPLLWAVDTGTHAGQQLPDALTCTHPSIHTHLL